MRVDYSSDVILQVSAVDARRLLAVLNYYDDDPYADFVDELTSLLTELIGEDD